MFRLSHIIPKGLEPVSNTFKQVQQDEDATNSPVLVQQAEEMTNSPVLVQQAEDTTNSMVLVQQAEETTNSKILLPTIVKGAKLADMEEVERIPSSAEPPTELSYPSVGEKLVGSDDDANNIIKKLTAGPRGLDVISIVGMAGIGKTALAGMVCRDVSVNCHFDVRAWCSLGQIYNVRKLIIEILRQITGDRYVNVDDPDDMLRKELFGKRYLIVLDDIWESESWDDLTRCFPREENRSRIMVTTRNAELARYIRLYSEPYLLPFLRDEESWELLQKKVFRGESCPLELRSVGPLVAKQCKGLPFLIIMIAGILSRKKREASLWLEVAYDIEPPTELSYPSVGEKLVGSDDDANNIIKKLTAGPRDLDVISIVGMAGIGKTALAGMVCRDVSVNCHFDVRAWCSLGQIYNVRKLIIEILRQITGDRYVNVDDPHDMVRKTLLGKRYLIVLDDIWESESWDDLRLCFPRVERGSRIMVTTRNAELARYIRLYSEPYLLPFLRDEESWELLQKKVFRGESCPLELRSVGPLVAKQCKGLPFLIIMIAGILSRKKREASLWLEVAYDIGSYTLEEGSMKMIQSSYDLLPDYLKPYLLYMGLFPKGYEIPVSDLLKWWIAEEFVPYNFYTGYDLEERSETHLKELVSRNLVVVSKTRANGEMKCCIILDQVREFCLAKIKEEKFMQHIGKRLCMYIQDTMTSDFMERESFGISQASFQFIAHPKFSISKTKNLFPLLNNFRLIRVLHLLDFYLDNSWAAACQSLTHLRYLAIFVKVFHFKWVSHLVHLQTLGVRSSYIMILPAIWKLEKLRHVDVNEFPIRWEDREQVKFEECTDIVLHNLKTLGRCSMSVADMTPKFWNKFPNLEQLRLHIDEFGDVPYYSDSRLMTLEMFPSRLRNLSLSETFLTDEIVSSIAKLQHLETLKLSEIYFTGEKHWDLGDKMFEELRVLKLHRVFMTEWICSEESFPVLECLVIRSCSKLEEIPTSFADIQTLRLIKVIDCSNSVGDTKENKAQLFKQENSKSQLRRH
ncbi:hypothetical protein BC332_34355 [Capsicum chinense]|nr:hypothetical protein BC332_34355 [Capsicum chinense]